MSFLIPTNGGNRPSINVTEPVMSDQEAEPVSRVMEVLELLMSESTDKEIRQKANHWLMDFQKSQDTHKTILEILYAALLPEKLEGSDSAARHLQAIGRADAAAQHQLLFFTAQTLNAKLRRVIGRVPRDMTHAEFTQEIYCKPTDLLVMARHSLDLPVAANDALGKSLALGVGQMCILELERTNGSVEGVHEVLRQCHLALKSDGQRYAQAAQMLESIASVSDPLPVLHEVTSLLSRENVDATFAIEVFQALATGAAQIVKARGLNEAVSISVRRILVETALAIIEIQRDSISRFLISHRQVFRLLRKLIRDVTPSGLVPPDIQTIATTATNQGKTALCSFSNLCDLLKEIYGSFAELSVKIPLPSDDVSVNNLLSPTIELTMSTLVGFMRDIEEVNICQVLAAADADFVRDYVDAIRQASVSVVEHTIDFLKRARVLTDRLNKGEAAKQRQRRASDGGGPVPPRDLDVLILGAVQAGDTVLGYSEAFSRASTNSSFLETYTRCQHRSQFSRSCAWLFVEHTEQDDESPTVSIEEQGGRRVMECQNEVLARAQDSERTVGRFWGGDQVNWAPIQRPDKAIITPQEIFPDKTRFSGKKKDAMEDDEFEDNEDDDMLWSTSSKDPLDIVVLLKRSLLLEESIGGFILGQCHLLYASTAKSLAPALSAALCFSKVDNQSMISPLVNDPLPRGVNSDKPARLLTTLAMAISVDMAITPSQIMEALKRFPCPFEIRDDNSTLSLVLEMTLMGIAPSTLTVMDGGHITNILDLLTSGSLAVNKDLQTTDVVISPYHQAYFDEPRGKSTLVEAMQRFVEILSRDWTLTKPLRNELGISDDSSFVKAWATWMVANTTGCIIYPVNYERGTAAIKNEIVGFRDDYRRLGKALSKILPLDMDVIYDSLSRHLNLKSEAGTWKTALQDCQQWKVYDATLITLTNTSRLAPARAADVLNNQALFDKALKHRAVLTSTLWCVSSLLPYRVTEDPKMGYATTMLCRAALRAPQFDASFPMTSREDHMGAVVFLNLTTILEEEVFNATALWRQGTPLDQTCLPRVKELYESLLAASNGTSCSLLDGLELDCSFLTSNIFQRATRFPDASPSGSYVQVSAKSLPMLYFSLGQFVATGTEMAGVLTEAEARTLRDTLEGFLLRVVSRLVSMFQKMVEVLSNVDPDAGLLTAGVLKMIVESIANLCTGATPILQRPWVDCAQVCGFLKLPKNLIASWGSEHTKVLRILQSPIPDRQTRGRLINAARDIRVESVKFAMTVLDRGLSKLHVSLIEHWIPLLNAAIVATTFTKEISLLEAMANIQAFVLASPADPKLLMSFLNGTMSTLRGNAHGAILVEKGYANMMASNVLGLLVMQPNQASPVVKMMNDFAEDHMCNTLQETFGLDRVVEEAPITATITNYLSREAAEFILPLVPSLAGPSLGIAINLAMLAILSKCSDMLRGLPLVGRRVPTVANQLLRVAATPNPTDLSRVIRAAFKQPLQAVVNDENQTMPPVLVTKLQLALQDALVSVQSAAAIRGSPKRGRGSVSPSPRGSIVVPSPDGLSPTPTSLGVNPVTIDQLPTLSWILMTFLIEQTSMTLCPSVSQKDLNICQNSLVEIVLACPPQVVGESLEAAQSMLCNLAVNNTKDPLPTSPFLWSSAPTTVSQVRLDIEKFLTSKSEELAKLERDEIADEDMEGFTKGGPTWYGVTMQLRRIFKRCTALINVDKRRSGGARLSQ